MAIYTGKNMKATFGATVIADLTSLSFNLDAPTLEEPVFGDEWIRVAGQGIKSASGSLEGIINTADTGGQNAIESAAISGTLITNLQLYINPTDYWASNTAVDTDAGAYFSNYNFSGGANDIIKFTSDFKFTGEVHRTS